MTLTVAIYALIRPYLDFARRNDTNVDIVEQDKDGYFANEIARYLETKREKSKEFHAIYYVMLGIIAVLGIVICLIMTDSSNIDEYSNYPIFFLSLIAVALSMKSLFMAELNYSHWVQILYCQDPNSARNELRRESSHSEQLDKNIWKWFPLGVLGGVLIGVLIVLAAVILNS